MNSTELGVMMKIYRVTNGRTFEIFFENEDDALKYQSGFSSSAGAEVTTIDVFPKGSVLDLPIEEE